ncbi:MAG: zinc ABC transporter substrate-binding protein, partial [Paracoccaceae bacterium]|nr:zinc ABC transporter substrate-binding protein [Paracoccaceae bacterium]
MTSLRSVFASATALATLSFTIPTASWAEQPIPVVATFSILGDMVERIGGEHIALTTLVGPEGDVHVYQPTPKAARSVAEADLLFMNGLEFEGWLERLAEAASFDGAMVVATTGISPIAFEEHEDNDHDEHDEHAGHDEHDEHAGHDHGTFDPHAWQSLDNAVIYANNIAAGLAQADPANASEYYTNRAVFVAEIVALKSDIDAMMAALPADKRTVVTPHDAFGYFAEAYNLTFEAPQGMSTESEVSAADVAALITQIRRESISAVSIESITDNRMMEQIANETGATIGGTLYSDARSGETGPAST